MKALIHNELFKIFHKKITWFFVIFVLVQYLFNVVFIKMNENYLENMDKNRVDYIIKRHNSMGEDVKKDFEMFISERNEIDAFELYKEFDRLSWQRYLIDNDGMKYISCMNFAKFKLNREDTYQECKDNLDKLMDRIHNSSWRDFVKEYQDDAVERLTNLKDAYDKELSDTVKADIELSMKSVQLEIDGYKYHLNNNIPIDYSDNSVMIDNYVSMATEYLSMEKDETKYKEYYQLLEKRDLENTIFTSKYRIEHKYDDITSNTALGLFVDYTCVSVNVIVLIYMIVVAGNSIADEYSKGTIKLLLVRPYKRVKILLSKYIATIISTILFYIFFIVTVFVACGIAKGFGSYFSPVVVYDFSIQSIREMGVFSYLLINTISFIPLFLILLSLTMFIGVFIKSEALTVGVPIVVYVISLFLNYSSTLKIMKYFPTLCWNLNEFLWGRLPTYSELTFKSSLVVCILTIIIVTLGSLSVFRSRDIKNQ